MKTEKGERRTQSGIQVLLLFLLFALMAVGVLLLGVTVYRDAQKSAGQNFTERTALSYLAGKIRQADREGAVSAVDFQGIPALALREEYEGVSTVTLLYYYDGAVRELFTEEGVELPPESGVSILKAGSFVPEEADGLLTLTVTDEWGKEASLSLFPRCGLAGE